MWASLPQYLAIGMPAEEFWHGPIRACEAYRAAWRARCENLAAAEWRQGLYVSYAVLSSLDKAFNGRKATVEYPDAPLFSPRESHEEHEARRERERMEAQRERVRAWAEAVNSRLDAAGTG